MLTDKFHSGELRFGANVGARDIQVPASDANSGKTVVTYSQKNGNNYPYAVVVTVSGTNLSFGTPVAMASAGRYATIVRYDSNAQKVLCIYNENGGTVRARVGTVSGTSISFGSEAVVSTYGGTSTLMPALVFDSNANKFLMVYLRYGTSISYARALTISGTSVSSGTEVVLEDGNNGTAELSFIPGINKIVATFWESAVTTYYQILSISGTSVVKDTSGIQYSGYSAASAFVVVAGDKHFLSSTNSAGETFFVEVEVTATEIKFAPANTAIIWGTGAIGGYASSTAVYDPDTSNIVFASTTNVRVFDPAAPSFVGIAAENISDGATGKVTVIGGINTSVSGLTAGKIYGSSASTAALTEIGPVGAGSFGVALSSSSIYLTVGKLL